MRLISLLDSEESGANNKTSLGEISILTMSNSVHPPKMGLVLYERRSSQLWTELLQLRNESLKKIQACTIWDSNP